MPVPARLRSAAYWLAWWGVFGLLTSGDLGSVDTARRLQVAHSWWTSSPEVGLGEWPEFGLPACGGTLRAWYGPGQSLLLLPADIVATQLTADPQVRGALVALLVFPALAVLTLACAEALLRQVGSSPFQARVSAALLAVATSVLPYAQINQENSLLFLLLLAGAVGAARFAATGATAPLVLASVAMGWSVLTRLPTAVDGIAVLAAATALRLRQCRREGIARRSVAMPVVWAGAGLSLSVVLDRVYHYARFCDWTTTYIGRFGDLFALRHPEVPAGFPFSTPLLEGLFGLVFSPDYSIVVTDPVLLLAFGIVVMGPRLRALDAGVAAIGVVGLAVAMGVYATYFNWWGGDSWGSRFTTAPVQLICLVVLGHVVREWGRLPAVVRIAAMAVLAAGVTANVSSVVFWYPLELLQRELGLGAGPILWRRLVNIAALAGDRWADWHLVAPGISTRSTTPNVLAWLAAGRAGEAAALLKAAWCAGMGVCLAVIARDLFPKARRARGD